MSDYGDVLRRAVQTQLVAHSLGPCVHSVVKERPQRRIGREKLTRRRSRRLDHGAAKAREGREGLGVLFVLRAFVSFADS